TQPNTFEKRLVKIGNAIYFSADDGVNGTELWRSDGTETGTFMVLDARPGASGFTPQNFAVLNDILYYKYDDAINGQELWRSDGTGSGTYLVKDVYPGSSGSFYLPTNIAAVEDKIWFGADGPNSTGIEVWNSDGTANGTALVGNINPGFEDSRPYQFISLPDIVFFAATGPQGTEMYKVDLNFVPLEKNVGITDLFSASAMKQRGDRSNILGGVSHIPLLGIQPRHKVLTLPTWLLAPTM
ncbi:MAG: hypothetical protein IPM82_32885, partial [Saprospiraceae bacterium]|nr:hypothetical protein [Saprospiraceae bacterium]